MIKNPPANAEDTGDVGSIAGAGRSLGVGNGNPVQYSCLGNPMGRGAWQATVHGVAKESDMTWRLNHHHHTAAETPQKIMRYFGSLEAMLNDPSSWGFAQSVQIRSILQRLLGNGFRGNSGTTWEKYFKCPHMYSQAKANLPMETSKNGWELGASPQSL